ncbi:hypothetical protein D9M70_395780 [compost metagenome]
MRDRPGPLSPAVLAFQDVDRALLDAVVAWRARIALVQCYQSKFSAMYLTSLSGSALSMMANIKSRLLRGRRWAQRFAVALIALSEQ